MIKVICEKCHKSLGKHGALVFSPPYSGVPSNNVLKFHLCRHCYSKLCDWIERSAK